MNSLRSPSSKAHSLAVGAGLGGAFAAGIAGILGTFLYFRYRPQAPKVDAFDTEARGDANNTRPRFSQTHSDPVSWTTDSQAPNDFQRSRTYVLHHDAGQAPVTVITDATEVVELPPRYRNDNNNSRALPVVREKGGDLAPVPPDDHDVGASSASSSSLSSVAS